MAKHKHSRHARRHKRHEVPGMAPGTLRAPPAALPPHVRVFSYDRSDLQELENATLADVAQLLAEQRRQPDDGVLWVDVEGLASVELVRGLGELFGLHPLSMEDVLHGQQRPKVEPYGDYCFITVQMPSRESLENEPAAIMKADGEPPANLSPPTNGQNAAVSPLLAVGDGRLLFEQLSLFFGRDFVLTFQDGLPGDCLEPVRQRIRKGAGRIREYQADHLMYALLDAVVDSAFPLLESYGEELDALEDRIMLAEDRFVLVRLHNAKQDLLALRRVSWPLRDLLQSLLRDQQPLVAAETRLYLRDCYDHVQRSIELLESYRELAADLLSLHLTTISNRMNEVMQVLTVFATIFIPLTFICSVYGMNFDPEVSSWNMPELRWRYGYLFSLGLMAAVAGTLLIFFFRKGWFRSMSVGRRWRQQSELWHQQSERWRRERDPMPRE